VSHASATTVAAALLALASARADAAAARTPDDVDPRTLYDVKDYRLELLVDPKSRTIRGFGATAGVATSDALADVVLDLGSDLAVSSVAQLEGDFFRTVLARTTPLPFDRDGDRLTVHLARPLAKGERFQVAVYYSGHPRRVDDFNGFQWATTPEGKAPWIATSCQTIGEQTWWPCKASFFHPEDKAEHVAVNVTAPDPLVVASNGRLVDVEHVAGLTTWRWRLDQPVPTYSIAFAIAPYVTIEQEARLPGLERPLQLRYYVLPEDEKKARVQFAQVPELLEFFSQKFGPYPFADAKFALAETPIWGMEHATVVAYGNSFPDAIRGSGVVDPYEQRNKLYDYVLVHETAHEWFGNAITAANWGDFWLHEGFATYAEALWVEHVHGLDAMLDFMKDKKAGISDLATVYRPRRESAGQAYDTQMYDKGAWLLHMLRHVLGDEPFFAAVKDFVNDPKLRATSAKSSDFQAACEKRAGRPLRSFFQPWLYGTRWPTYTVHAPKLEGNKATVAIECKSQGQFDYEMPLDLVARCADGSTVAKRVTLVKGANSVVVEAAAPVKKVEYPGFRWILCDVRFVP
jgi:aminopeptidase N